MKKILHELTPEQIKTGPTGDRVVFLHLVDGQVIKVDLNLYTEEEIHERMDHYNSYIEGFDLHVYMGTGINTEEVVELGFLTYFEGNNLKIIETIEEVVAALPGHKRHWETIINGLEDE